MNNIISINGDDYAFHFGMRVFWYVTQSGEIEFDQVEQKISSDYDSFLEIFVRANESAIDRKESDEEPITKKQLERAIDDDPDLMFTLQEAFENSQVIKRLEERMEEGEDEAEEVGNEKKPSG